MIRDCTVENADRFFHYNYFNEQWQKGVPLKSIVFERVTARGLKLPLCAWGDAYEPLSLTIRDCSLSFGVKVPELAKGSWIGSLELSGVAVEGVDGPLLRLWNADCVPAVALDRIEGVDGRVEQAHEPFKVKGI